MAKTSWRRPGRMVPSLLRSLFRKPATTRYPFVKWEMPDRFRARPVVHTENCIGCKMCVRNCPSSAIQIEDKGEKRFEATIDLGRCVYCGQCAYICPKKTIELTKDFELAAFDRASLVVVYHAQPPAPAEESPASAELASGQPAEPNA
jgi:formate hydrogenlyase subunit 6/NADH:ubiquinone oxidoreductase subunit I